MQRLFTTIHRSKTSKRIATRLNEHKNAIKRHDLRSLPTAHTYDNCHTFNWTKTQLLGRAKTKYTREFKEAWHSTDDDSINRHIDIPTVYLQLKTVRKNSANNDTNITNTNIVGFPIALQSTSRTRHSYHSNDTLIPYNNVQSSMTTHPSITNDNTSSCKKPIRRF